MGVTNGINEKLMVEIAEQAVIDEIKRRVRKTIEDAINPIIDDAVNDICKDVSGEAFIERDIPTMRDILVLAVSNKKPPINQTDDS